MAQQLDSQAGYRVTTTSLESQGDIPEMRFVASTLETPVLSSSHANYCIMCAAVGPGLQSTQSSNQSRLCLGPKKLLPQCAEGMVLSNSTALCAATVQQQPLLQEVGFASGSQPTVTIDMIDTITDPTEASETVGVIDTTTQEPQMATTRLDTTAAPFTQAATTHPPQRTMDASPPSLESTTTPPSTSARATTRADTTTAPQASVEGGLFVAIAICSVFIVIIIILMSIVICLFRQWKWKREKEARLNEDESKFACLSAHSLGGIMDFVKAKCMEWHANHGYTQSHSKLVYFLV